ncbi:MAG: hypothetical protein RIT15_1694 [Pseudomonadota bacterium]|jgi:hypothetical protein
MPRKTRFPLAAVWMLCASWIVGCAAVAPQPWDRPVVASKVGGHPLSETITDTCIAKAVAAGLTPLLEGSTERKVLRNQAYRDHVGNCILAQDYVILGWN